MYACLSPSPTSPDRAPERPGVYQPDNPGEMSIFRAPPGTRHGKATD